MDRIVIIGAGQAGFQCAASLRESGFDGWITLVGDEPHLPYNRPPLSKAFLTGETDAASVTLRPFAFFNENRIELQTGKRAIKIDRKARKVIFEDRGSLAYDHLVLATGTRNRVLPMPGGDLDGVTGLRSLVEASRLKAELENWEGALLVIGAGFIGLEVASAAAALGHKVTVVELAPRSMARAVSPEVSSFSQRAAMGMGVTFLFGRTIRRLVGENGRVCGVELDHGEILPARTVLAGIGVVPNTELASAAELAIDNGIAVDGFLATVDPQISAIGDCASYPSVHAGIRVRLESVQNSTDQARALAARLTGHPTLYNALPWFWSDQGKQRLQIAGLSHGADQIVLRGSPEAGRFSCFCFCGQRLVAVESVNSPADHLAARRLFNASAAISPQEAADESFSLKQALARTG